MTTASALQHCFGQYSSEQHELWARLSSSCTAVALKHAHPSFIDGLHRLKLVDTTIPSVASLNEKLAVTGWSLTPVPGYITSEGLFSMFQRRTIPVAMKMRLPSDEGYSPDPDLFHDLYGHAPFLFDSGYTSFLARLGALAAHAPTKRRAELAHLYWWTAEVGLIGNPTEPRIYGAAILSSTRESSRALYEIEHLPLGERCLGEPYDIRLLQDHYFLVPSFAALSDFLDHLRTSA